MCEYTQNLSFIQCEHLCGVSIGLLMRGLLCVVCLSTPAFSLHRWIAQQWVKRKQSTSVFLASTYPLSRQGLFRAFKLAMHGNWAPYDLRLIYMGLGGGIPLDMWHARPTGVYLPWCPWTGPQLWVNSWKSIARDAREKGEIGHPILKW